MSKQFSKPWFRPSRQCWYITLDGKQHSLGRVSEEEAWEKAIALKQSLENDLTVIQSEYLAPIIDEFLVWISRNRSPDTLGWYQYRLQRFVDKYPKMRVDQLKPIHVERWVADYQLSVTSIRNYKRSIKACLNWAYKQGVIAKNPIEHLEVPKANARERIIDQKEFDWLLEQATDSNFQDLLTVSWETGCRPQESLRVEARHFESRTRRWVFPPSEGKTGGRVVYLTDRAFEITERLVEQYPDGRLFRNHLEVPWTISSVNCRFKRIKKRTGKQFSLYLLRHSFCHRALQRGLDCLTVAVLMGHKNPSMVASTYSHLSQAPDYLLKSLKQSNDFSR